MTWPPILSPPSTALNSSETEGSPNAETRYAIHDDSCHSSPSLATCHDVFPCLLLTAPLGSDYLGLKGPTANTGCMGLPNTHETGLDNSNVATYASPMDGLGMDLT